MSGMDDPRVHEFREARAASAQGLSAPTGARERYRESIPPYLTFMAEFCPDDSSARRHLMASLFYDSQLPLGAIAIAFRATEQEIEWVSDQEQIYVPPPTEKERRDDEQARLRYMSYGLYLKTPHWQSVRKAALARAENRCALCNDIQNLEVHHRTYSRRGAERPADVVVLCGACHSRFHGKLRAA